MAFTSTCSTRGFGPPYGCWCDTCRREFEQEFSRPPPKGATWDGDWERMLEFRYRSSERFEQALAAHIKALNPRASVDFNYHGNPRSASRSASARCNTRATGTSSLAKPACGASVR